MKGKKNIIITGMLLAAIALVNTPASVYAVAYEKGKIFLTEFFDMTEEDIYDRKLEDTGEELIMEIKELEKEFKDDNDKIVLVPHANALIAKNDDFTSEEIIALLEKGGNGEVLESALILMYTQKNAEPEALLNLIDSGKIKESSKDYIVAKSNLNTMQLSSLIENNNDSVSVVAMKKLMVEEPNKAFEIARSILDKPSDITTDEKMWAACLGIGEYYNKSVIDNEQKNVIVEQLKTLHKTSNSDFLKDKIVYSLANMQDFDVFSYIIKNDDIDDALKVSSIERNVQLLVNKTRSNLSSDELECIITAMEIHPILDIGKALEKSIENGNIVTRSDISSTIQHIENHGVEGVYKYD